MFVPTADAVVANRYRLIREIGRGGMGCVWQAIDGELDAPCALKFILNQHSRPKHVRARFAREARAAAKLQSPYVVSVRGVGEWQDAMYIAMELLAGENLAQRLARTGTLTPRETARVVQQVASVLEMSHRASIVHRDLKPENLWLWAESDVFVKVLDFGVAKHIQAADTLTKTNSGALIGSPHYMSPEQAAGDRAVDHRTDLWSLAVIAVQCLSGRRPFRSSGLGQVLSDIINGRAIPLQELYPERSRALEVWWARATAKDPKQRYSSALEFARDFTLAVDSSSIAAPAVVSEQAPEQLSAGVHRPQITIDVQTSALQSPTRDVASGFDSWRAKAERRPSSSATLTAEVAAIPSVRWPAREVAIAAALGLVAGGGWFLARVPSTERHDAPSEPITLTTRTETVQVVSQTFHASTPNTASSAPVMPEGPVVPARAPAPSPLRVSSSPPKPPVTPATTAPPTPNAARSPTRVPTNAFPEAAGGASAPLPRGHKQPSESATVDPRIGF